MKKSTLIGLIKICPLIFFLSVFTNDVFSQIETASKGIHFENHLTWTQVKAKAKAENKCIFLDCFTTWCGPCHMMDQLVYTNDTVAEILNKNFISVKVQMDKTDHDDSQIKSWYNDVDHIESNYSVDAFPTFLFFDTKGSPVHRSVGFKNSGEFITLVRESQDTSKQYYRMLANFQPGKMDTAEMKDLARALRYSGNELAVKIAVDYPSRIPFSGLGQPDNIKFMIQFSESQKIQEIAVRYLGSIPRQDLSAASNHDPILVFKKNPQLEKIVLEYISGLNNQELRKNENLDLLSIFEGQPKAKEIADKYIKQLPQNELYTHCNIQFLINFTKNSNDIGFNIFYHHSVKVDSVMGMKGYGQYIAYSIIDKEEAHDYWVAGVNSGKIKIDWNKISKEVTKKYSKKDADWIVLNSKTEYYRQLTVKDSSKSFEYIKYAIEKMEKYGTDTTNKSLDVSYVNVIAWDIFIYSTKKWQLNLALKWMEGVVRRTSDAGCLDTYANLNYKLGKRDLAIEWEEKAAKIAMDKCDLDYQKLFLETVSKMKADEPTWIRN